MKRTGLIAMCLMLLLTFAFSGCGGKKTYETEYFTYYLQDGVNKEKLVIISGLTELGNQQKILVIPRIIDGRRVLSLGDTAKRTMEQRIS